jgi:hypothetical protein
MIKLWLPIVVASIRIVGRHPRFARLVVVRFELDRRPPTRWVDLFARVAPGPRQMPGVAEPHLLDGLVQVDARDEALDQDVEDVLLHIDATNRWYEEELCGAALPLPPQDSPQDEARIQQARVRAARLTREFARMRLTKSTNWTTQTVFQPGTPSDKDI